MGKEKKGKIRKLGPETVTGFFIILCSYPAFPANTQF